MTETLTRDRFADRFTESSGVLWTAAAAVVGDRSAAEDVLQEACVIGLRKLEQFDATSNFTAWMGRIVRLVALNHLRTRGRRPVRTEDPEVIDRIPRAAVAPGHHELDGELASALEALKPMARTCLLLRTLHDMDYREISEMLGIPEGTAMSHVHRARAQLRRRLEGRRDAAAGVTT